MKKLISFLVSSIFVFTSYTQVHMLLRANIKDTLVIDKYEPQNNGFLNKIRLVELYNFLPTAFNRQVFNWRIIKQTGVIKTGGINIFFHGFVVYYRPMPTYMDENTLIANIVSGKTKPEDSTQLKTFDRNLLWENQLDDIFNAVLSDVAQIIVYEKFIRL
jgi:hypothetical protein